MAEVTEITNPKPEKFDGGKIKTVPRARFRLR